MLVDNLTNTHVLALLVVSAQPSDDRLVIIQDIQDDRVMTAGARFRDDQWYGETTGELLKLSDRAIWAESFYFLDSSQAVNRG